MSESALYRGTKNYARALLSANATFRTRQCQQNVRGLSVIILNLNKPDLILPLLASLVAAKPAFAAAGLLLDVLVGDTGSTDLDVLAAYEKYTSEDQVRFLRNLKYNFSSCNNDVFYQISSCDNVLFLNNDVIFADPATSLLTIDRAIRDLGETTIVGPVMYFGDGKKIQHAGVDFLTEGDWHGLSYHIDYKKENPLEIYPPRSPTHAITGACLATSAKMFERLGGFDEHFAAECQDIDLCLKFHRIGGKSVLLNAGKIRHLENETRPKGEENWSDRSKFLRLWRHYIGITHTEYAQ